MDSRTLLAITLILIVLILPSLIFQPPAPVVPAERPPDSLGVRAPPVGDFSRDERNRLLPAVVPAPALVPEPPAEETTKPVIVESPLYRYSFSPRGARLIGAELLEYRSFSQVYQGVAQLIPDASECLVYRLVFGNDTISLADWHF